jgi:uncharacterized protein
MRKIFSAVVIFGAILFVFIKTILAAEFPPPSGYVNDFASILSSSVKAELEQELQDFKQTSGHEIALVTLKSLQGDSIENVAVAIFEQWGIGTKEKDNGVLLLVAPQERKLRIEVGYGLESVLTDSRAGHIPPLSRPWDDPHGG